MKRSIIFSLFLVTTSALASLGSYVSVVSAKCDKLPTLLIKKSALELNTQADCRQPFTFQLLESCKTLSCESLTRMINENLRDHSRSVVGE